MKQCVHFPAMRKYRSAKYVIYLSLQFTSWFCNIQSPENVIYFYLLTFFL